MTSWLAVPALAQILNVYVVPFDPAMLCRTTEYVEPVLSTFWFDVMRAALSVPSGPVACASATVGLTLLPTTAQLPERSRLLCSSRFVCATSTSRPCGATAGFPLATDPVVAAPVGTTFVVVRVSVSVSP
jgi:hypothetical protein